MLYNEGVFADPYYVASFDVNMTPAEAPAEIFSGGGKRLIHYLLDQSKPYSCNQDFSKEFEPKVKMIVFKKCCNSGGTLS